MGIAARSASFTRVARVLLVAAAALATTAVACERTPKKHAGHAGAAPSLGAYSTSTPPPSKALEGISKLAYDAATAALAQSKRVEAELAGGCAPSMAYLAMRRAIARGKQLFRASSPRGTEVLLGPVRPVSEGGGALALVDRTLSKRACEQARAPLFQAQSALELIALEIAHDGVTPMAAARALSESAFELGAVVTESSAEIGVGEEAIIADAQGLLDGLEAGVALLAANAPYAQSGVDAVARLAALRKRLDAGALTGRAATALETGYLGAEVRALAGATGVLLAAPFAARIAVASTPASEPVSVLTVPGPKVVPEALQVARGRALFTDPRLSESGRRSCASCHDPARSYADGRAFPISLLGTSDILRNTPSLLYVGAQSAFLWDGRVSTAAAQALHVIHSAGEMGLSRDLLKARLGDPETVGRALGAFEDAELVPDNAPIDRFARGDRSALSPSAQRGFDVFAGPGRCARCHVPPLYGGTRPTDFAVTVYAVLGIPKTPAGKVLDADRGRAGVTQRAEDERSFKTPHLRNVARTAPYFHNGAFPTLESVVDFYALGGGRGLGLDVPNQDPDVQKLTLTREERRDLLEFMRMALTDGPTK